MNRSSFLVMLAVSVLVTSASPARGSGICEPIKGAVAARLQPFPGGLTLQGAVAGTVGGDPVVGSSVTVISTPIQGIDKVENPTPTEGGSAMEVFDEAKPEPPQSFSMTVRGMLIPTHAPDVLLLVVHARVTGAGSGEILYQGTLDLEEGTAAVELSGAVCL